MTPEQKDKLIAITKKLVSFRSTTPKGLDALEYMADLLRSLGFKSDIQSFGDGDKKTHNLFAIRNAEKAKFHICFAGHVDVVPAGDMSLWLHNPFDASIENDTIYGRGIVDMKGAIACAYLAISQIINERLDSEEICYSFLLTTDEEGSGTYGTKMMLEYIKGKYPSIDVCIVGEPTCKLEIGDTIKIGRRGSLNAEIEIYGQAGHSAYPDDAKNAAHIVTNLATTLINFDFDEQTASHLNESEQQQAKAMFQKTNLQITSIDIGNKVSNIIPNKAKMQIGIRFNPLHTAENLINEIQKLCSVHGQFQMKSSCNSHPFMQKPNKYILKFKEITEKITNIKSKLSCCGGTSDARFIHKYCTVIEFGLKHAQAHKINEHSKICDLQMLYNVYYAYLAGLR